jgi:hypothetical protein
MTSNRPQQFNPLRFVQPIPTAGARQAMVAEMAYFLAQQRGFLPGHDLDDWLAAEALVDQRRDFDS